MFVDTVFKQQFGRNVAGTHKMQQASPSDEVRQLRGGMPDPGGWSDDAPAKRRRWPLLTALAVALAALAAVPLARFADAFR